MFPSRSKRLSNKLADRRAEIFALLDERGLSKRRYGINQPLEVKDNVDQVADLLVAIGPVFAQFGRYLSSRPDHLCVTDCVTLSKIANRAKPSENESIRRIMVNEFGDRIDDSTVEPRFVKFDPEPFESRLLCQLHYGQLENDDLVVVQVAHPNIVIDDEVELIPLVAHLIAPRLADPQRFASVASDFRRDVNECVNFERKADALELFAHDSRDRDSIVVPKVYRDLCTENILVTQRIDGLRLDRYIQQCNEQREQNGKNCSVAGIISDELARLLCDIWLRQTFDGTLIPLVLDPENILIRSPTEIAIVDGVFSNLPAASRRNLLDYFIAVATDEPGQALRALQRELDVSRSTTSDSELDRQFRQIVAFRDGGWNDGGKTNCLSETLFAQWHLLSENGNAPLQHLTQLYRGTFQISLLARQIAPNRDSLHEGVKDLRLTKLLSDIGTMLEPSYWGGQADKLAGLLILGPQNLDEALKAMQEDQDRPQVPVLNNGFFSRIQIVLVCLAFAIIYSSDLTVSLSPDWSNRLLAIVFVLAGASVLREFAHTRPR